MTRRLGFFATLLAAGIARAQAAPTPEAAPPAKEVAVGTDGFFKPGLLLQPWFVYDKNTPNTFRIRRAEIYAKGEIVRGLFGYNVMIDPSKALEFQNAPVDNASPMVAGKKVQTLQPAGGRSSILQDAYATLLTPYADVSIGQFKNLVSWEGSNSSARLLFPERAIVVNQYGDRRDMGIKWQKTLPWFGYAAAIQNGSGTNVLDKTNAKDLQLRLEFYPVAGLLVGGVGQTTITQRNQPGLRDRFEGDLRFEHGPLLVQGEYIRAKDIGDDKKTVNAWGAYGSAAFTLMKTVQPAVRFGYFDPNTAADNDQVRQIDAGLNYFIRGHEAKVQVAFTRFMYGAAAGKKDDNQVIAATQVFY